MWILLYNQVEAESGDAGLYVTPAPWRLRQEDFEFEAILGYMKKKKKKR